MFLRILGKKHASICLKICDVLFRIVENGCESIVFGGCLRFVPFAIYHLSLAELETAVPRKRIADKKCYRWTMDQMLSRIGIKVKFTRICTPSGQKF